MSTIPDEISVTVDGKRFSGWTSIEVSRAMDAFSTVKLVAPFDPTEAAQRALFTPFKFGRIDVNLGDYLLFKGTVVGVEPEADADSASVSLSAYSLPGVLGDCHLPKSALPSEFKKLSLDQLVAKLAEVFGLESVVSMAKASTPFAKLKVETTQTPLDFINNLVKQRGGLVSSTRDGKLLCYDPTDPGSPVAYLRLQKPFPDGSVTVDDGASSVSKITATFNAQDYFSEITGFSATRRKDKGRSFTELNPWLRNVMRPTSFSPDSADGSNIEDAVKHKHGLMFANMASYVVEDMPTWLTPKGELWSPNTTVSVIAPEVLIYEKYEFLIREVTFKADANSMTSSLNLVMPGVFSAKAPKTLPWTQS